MHPSVSVFLTLTLSMGVVDSKLVALLKTDDDPVALAGHQTPPPLPPTTADGHLCVDYKADVTSCGSNCSLHILNNSIATHGAGCLDGSPPGFYFRPGRGADASKFLLWSHGGGWCRNEGECAGRALTYEGSSRCNPPKGPPRQNAASGIMSPDCSINPHFCNWSLAYFIYCDGASWTGNRDQAIPTSQAEYANTATPTVHFKGSRNLQAIMDTLLSPAFGMGSADKVLYAGASAGGLTPYLHCENVRAMVPDSTTVNCLGDAGFFIDHQSVNGQRVYRETMSYAFRMHNATGSVNEECIASKAGAPDLHWMCFFADYSLPHIRTPFFISNSNFDSWSMGAILGAQTYYTLSHEDQLDYTACTNKYSECKPSWKLAVDGWGAAFRRKLAPALAAPQHGVFVNNCHRHHNIDGAEAFTTKINGTSLVEAVAAWIGGVAPAPKLLDTLVPGENPTC